MQSYNSQKPDLLFVSPVLPGRDSDGRSLRAQAWLKALSQTYNVHVLVITTQANITLPESKLYQLTLIQIPLQKQQRLLYALIPFLVLYRPYNTDGWVLCDKALAEQLDNFMVGRRFDRLVVFRLYLHEVAKALKDYSTQLKAELDLDDLESRTRLSIAKALLRRRQIIRGMSEISQALRYLLLEQRCLSTYTRIYLAASEDVELVKRTQPGLKVEVFSNQIDLVTAVIPLPDSSCLKLLFVGNLAYYPNEDAVLYLLTQLVPELKRRLKHPWHLTIVGRGASPSLIRHCQKVPEVEFVGEVTDTTPYYQKAHAVVIPLWAGGGTKLKILEAILHERLVVTTEQGSRGLGLLPGQHYMLAHNKAEFAKHCESVLLDLPQAERLAQAAKQFILSETEIHEHSVRP